MNGSIFLRRIMAGGLCMVIGTAALAGAPVLNLSVGSTDLSSLEVNDAVTVNVELSGLDAGDTLDLLAATIAFDQTTFGTPTITAGGIIPDAAGFVAAEDPGLADGTFDALFTTSGTDTIDTNGLFFAFEVTALAEGAGTIDISFADALGSMATGADIDGVAVGSALSFTVVPEPSAALSFLAVCTAACGRRRLCFDRERTR